MTSMIDQSSSIDPQSKTSEADVALQGIELSAALTVADVERSLGWYKEMLGFSIARKFEREGKLTAVSLMAGQVRILLGQDDGAKGLNRVKGEGFSLQITTS